MTDTQAAVAYRVLGPRAILNDPADGDSLRNVDTTPLPNGAACWVTASRAEFRLYKDDNSTPPDGTNVIQPASGPGRWFIQVNTGSGVQIENVLGLVLPQRPLVQTEGMHPVDTGTAIQLVDGEVDALAWPSLSAAVAANPGRTLILINGTHIVDADLNDPTVTLKFRQGTILSVPADRTVGTRIDASQGGLIVLDDNVTLEHTAPILVPDTARLWNADASGAQVLGAPGVVAHVTPMWFGALPDGVTDSTKAFNAMREFWVSIGGGIIKLPASPDAYIVTNGYWARCAPGATRCVIQMDGASIINTSASANAFDRCPFAGNLAMFAIFPGNHTMVGATLYFGELFQSAAAGDVSVTLQAGADMTPFVAGKRVCLHGYGTQNGSWPPNERYFEFKSVLSVNAGTKTITFDQPLQYSYDERWADTFTSSGAGGLPHYGAPRIISLDRDDFTWGEELVIEGGNFLGNPAFVPVDSESNGRLQISGYRKAILRNVTAAATVPQLGEEVVYDNVHVTPTSGVGSGILEMDKIVRRVIFNGGDIGELSNGFAVLYMQAVGLLVRQFTNVAPREQYWRQCEFHGNGNGGTNVVCYVNNAFSLPKVEFDQCKVDTSALVPGSAAGMVLGGDEQSFTVDSVTSDTLVIVAAPTQADVAVLYRSLEVGRVVYKKETGVSGRITAIYSTDATHVAVEGVFSDTPLAGDVFRWNNINELVTDVRAIDPTSGIAPVKDQGSPHTEARTVYGGQVLLAYSDADLPQPASTDVIQDRVISIEGRIDMVRVTVLKAYSGASANAHLSLYDDDTNTQLQLWNLKNTGGREVNQWFVANQLTGDALTPLEATLYRRLILRVGTGVSYLAYTSPVQLPRFLVEITVGRPL